MTEKNKEVTFNWTPNFEVGLARLMLRYRIQHRPEGSIETEIAFEKRHARDFATALRTLMAAHALTLADDSDIAEGISRMRLAHHGAAARDAARFGGGR